MFTPSIDRANALMPSATPSKLLIVDGHAYAYRAFHAIRELSSPSGAPTNAIYGFIKMLAKLRQQLQPSHGVVVWDGGLSADRTSAHPGYKAERPAMPDALEQQLDGITRYLEAAGITSLCREGVEADDWIAALAHQLVPQTLITIASSDKDFMQLVCDRITLANPNDKSETLWGAEQVRAKAGVDPHQIVDWLSLIGDAVDNIPGVPGVGPKTATDLLQQFGSVESLYSRLLEVKSERVRLSLQSSADIVRRNQALIRLKEDQVAPPLAELVLRDAQGDRLRSLYAEWGFRTLLAQIAERPLEQGALL